MRSKDVKCFGDRTNEDLDTDFDFEGNLALFDKAAIFSQIDGSSGHKAPHHCTQAEQKPQSYRHDENILEGKPVEYKQITVPQHGGKYYCTGKKKMFPYNWNIMNVQTVLLVHLPSTAPQLVHHSEL